MNPDLLRSAHTSPGKRLLATCIITLVAFSFVHSVSTDSLIYRVEQTTTASDGIFAPFWLHNQQFGTISEQAFSTTLRASVDGTTVLSPQLKLKYGIDALCIASNGRTFTGWIQQAYLHTHWLIFDLKLGAQENQLLLTDRYLSSGAFLFSPGARPMPGITAGIEQFTSVPFTHNQVKFRGGITHAWFTDEVYVPDIWLHHKYFHLRLGDRLPVRLQLGLDHMAQWGGKLPGQPSQAFNFANFKTIFLARSGGEGSSVFEQNNAAGNHILSEHARLEITTGNFNTSIYWQNIIEDSPFRLAPWKMMNREDGLWGISVENNSLPYFQKLVLERINTTDQSGYIHDKDGIVYGGQDSYFTNGTYLNDWAFHRRSIGTPLILSPIYNPDGSYRINHIWIKAYHAGLSGHTQNWAYRIMGTYVQHYNFYLHPFTTNTYWLLEVSRALQSITLSVRLAADTGIFPGPATGIQFSFKKSGILFRP